MSLGKVVKSNSHCDYLVQVNDRFDVNDPPAAHTYGFGSFVRLDSPEVGYSLGFGARKTLQSAAVGIVYNSQLINPQFLNTGPRLSSDADPLFTPDLVEETRTLLSVVLIGELIPYSQDSKDPSSPDRPDPFAEESDTPAYYGQQGIPRAIVPINAIVSLLGQSEIRQFHNDRFGHLQFRYHSLLLRYGGSFASHLTEQVLQELVDLRIFQNPAQQRALTTLCREMSWRNTLGTLK
jgi:hypothetical protein